MECDIAADRLRFNAGPNEGQEYPLNEKRPASDDASLSIHVTNQCQACSGTSADSFGAFEVVGGASTVDCSLRSMYFLTA